MRQPPINFLSSRSEPRLLPRGHRHRPLALRSLCLLSPLPASARSSRGHRGSLPEVSRREGPGFLLRDRPRDPGRDARRGARCRRGSLGLAARSPLVARRQKVRARARVPGPGGTRAHLHEGQAGESGAGEAAWGGRRRRRRRRREESERGEERKQRKLQETSSSRSPLAASAKPKILERTPRCTAPTSGPT